MSKNKNMKNISNKEVLAQQVGIFGLLPISLIILTLIYEEKFVIWLNFESLNILNTSIFLMITIIIYTIGIFYVRKTLENLVLLPNSGKHSVKYHLKRGEDGRFV